MNLRGCLPTPSFRILMCNIGNHFLNHSGIMEDYNETSLNTETVSQIAEREQGPASRVPCL